MLRSLTIAGLLPLLLLASPASAVTAKQKLETCTFGANDQKLTGAKRKHFIARCMANENYKPKTTAMTPKPAPDTKKP